MTERRTLDFSTFPELETANLRFRRMTAEDREALYGIRCDQETAEVLGRPIPKAIAEVDAFIEKIDQGIEANQWISWALEEKASGVYAGGICFWNFNEANTVAEIGYELAPGFRGRGLIQEAVEATLRYGFETLQLEAVEGVTSEENQKSIHLMRAYGFEVVSEFQEENPVTGKTVKMLVLRKEK